MASNWDLVDCIAYCTGKPRSGGCSSSPTPTPRPMMTSSPFYPGNTPSATQLYCCGNDDGRFCCDDVTMALTSTNSADDKSGCKTMTTWSLWTWMAMTGGIMCIIFFCAMMSKACRQCKRWSRQHRGWHSGSDPNTDNTSVTSAPPHMILSSSCPTFLSEPSSSGAPIQLIMPPPYSSLHPLNPDDKDPPKYDEIVIQIQSPQLASTSSSATYCPSTVVPDVPAYDNPIGVFDGAGTDLAARGVGSGSDEDYAGMDDRPPEYVEVDVPNNEHADDVRHPVGDVIVGETVM